MSLDVLYEKWQKISARAKEQWGHFIQDDLCNVEIEYNKLVCLLQQHYGYSKEQARVKADLCLMDHESVTCQCMNENKAELCISGNIKL